MTVLGLASESIPGLTSVSFLRYLQILSSLASGYVPLSSTLQCIVILPALGTLHISFLFLGNS